MIGAIIGDIIGSRYEFDHIPRQGFQLYTDDDAYTDDTVCTIAVADAILNRKSYRDTLLHWCRRYRHPKGSYGNMFAQWIDSANPLPQASWGNGAAMRVSPVGWLFEDYHEVLDEAKAATEVSHCHREGIKGAQCVATLIYWLRTVRITKNEVENAVRRTFGYVLPSLEDIYKIGGEGHFDASCQETVPWAIRCFLESSSFEDAIRISVMARGDTDTKAAITGSIAEAYYNIPDHLVEQAYDYLEPDMLTVVQQFYERIQQDLVG